MKKEYFPDIEDLEAIAKETRIATLKEVLRLFLRKAMKYDYFNSEFVIEFQKELEAKLKEVQK